MPGSLSGPWVRSGKRGKASPFFRHSEAHGGAYVNEKRRKRGTLSRRRGRIVLTRISRQLARAGGSQGVPTVQTPRGARPVARSRGVRARGALWGRWRAPGIVGTERDRKRIAVYASMAVPNPYFGAHWREMRAKSGRLPAVRRKPRFPTADIYSWYGLGMNANLYHRLYRAFSGQLDKICLRSPGGEVWRYGELHDLSGRLASVLLAKAEPGDRILVQVDKSPEAVALYLACLRGGLVLTPLNTAYTAAELDYFIGDADPALTVFDDTLAQLCARARGVEPGGGIADLENGDPAAILYTSGTTGRSKGAVLSHGNLSSNASALHEIWGFEPGDVLLHALPIFHAHGLFVALNTAMLNASTILFLKKFETGQVLEQLPRATVMMGVPTYYTRLLADDRFGPRHYRHMRLFISGSAPLSERTFAEFEARTGKRILERYGMSEAGMIASNPLDGDRIAGTVGYALPDVEVRVRDDRGQPLPAGEVGTVETRGPNVFAGYRRKTAGEFRDDGWFITGDMGFLEADGRLHLVGRKKDLIISGGYNVYPREVELALDETEGIAESAVIGVPHGDLGEAVIALCVPSAHNLPPQAEILERISDRLARFKQPKTIIRMDELPRNNMGKVQKNKLRERFSHLFDEGRVSRRKASS